MSIFYGKPWLFLGLIFLMVEDPWYLQSLDSEQMVGHMSRLTSAFSPMIILTTELMHAGLRLVSKITFVDNILRLMIDEDWRGRKPPLGQRNSCMYACIKEKLEPMFGQWLCRPTQAVVVVVFLHDKVFCQFLLRTPRFHFTLSLSLLN